MDHYQQTWTRTEEPMTWQQKEGFSTKKVGMGNVSCFVCFTCGPALLHSPSHSSRSQCHAWLKLTFTSTLPALLLSHAYSRQQSQRRSCKAKKAVPFNIKASTQQPQTTPAARATAPQQHSHTHSTQLNSSFLKSPTSQLSLKKTNRFHRQAYHLSRDLTALRKSLALTTRNANLAIKRSL